MNTRASGSDADGRMAKALQTLRLERNAELPRKGAAARYGRFVVPLPDDE